MSGKRPKSLRYAFDDIFTYYPQTDIIVPQFTVVINNVISKKDVPIRNNYWDNNLNRPGLDLFRHIGQAFAGEWDDKAEMLHIKGIYTS